MAKFILSVCAVLFIWSTGTQAGELPVGSIKTITGMVSLERQGQIITPREGEKIFQNDFLRTGPDGTVGMIFKDDTLLSLGPNTVVTIKEFLFSPAEGKLSIVTRLIKGTAAYLSGIIGKLSPKAIQFETPVGTVGIRGTKIAVKVAENESGS
jgi:hypothetical protein